MDGENHGKPYDQMDDLGGKPTIFGFTPICRCGIPKTITSPKSKIKPFRKLTTLRRGTQFLETLQHFRQARLESSGVNNKPKHRPRESVDGNAFWKFMYFCYWLRYFILLLADVSIVFSLQFVNFYYILLFFLHAGINHMFFSPLAYSETRSLGEIYGGSQQLDWMIEDVDFGGDWNVESEGGMYHVYHCIKIHLSKQYVDIFLHIEALFIVMRCKKITDTKFETQIVDLFSIWDTALQHIAAMYVDLHAWIP